MKVIPETRCVHYIWYLCFYCQYTRQSCVSRPT